MRQEATGLFPCSRCPSQSIRTPRVCARGLSGEHVKLLTRNQFNIILLRPGPDSPPSPSIRLRSPVSCSRRAPTNDWDGYILRFYTTVTYTHTSMPAMPHCTSRRAGTRYEAHSPNVCVCSAPKKSELYNRIKIYMESRPSELHLVVDTGELRRANICI